MSEVIKHVSSITPDIHFTESAVKHLVIYLDKNPGHVGVSLSVKKTGCSGMSYVLDYIQATTEGALIIPLSEEYIVSIDKASYPYIRGTTVDYIKEGLNYKFVFQNPNQTGQCGCGESFTVRELD
jgi:iron-sulfur cluster assembly protein